VITEPGVFLGKTSKRAVVKKQRRVIMEILLKQLRHVIISTTGVTLSSAVIALCAREQVPIHFLTSHGEPLARLCTPLDTLGNTGLQQLQAVHDGSGLVLAKTFVTGKLRNQFNLVKYYHKYRKHVDEDFARAFDDVEQQFDALLADLRAFTPAGDYDAMRQQLFAFEGRGGNLYWQMIRLLLEDDVEFAGRERQGATDLVNSLLNYGYDMLYPRVHHALVLAGLHPGISFLHSFQDGKPTLAFDLIEEFRPQAVDRAVFSMITKGEELAIDAKTDRLTQETVRKLIQNILERLTTPIRYRSQEKSLQEIIHLQARLLAAHLHGKRRYRPFIGRW
jgi:CRISPR-associated protein Cas1